MSAFPFPGRISQASTAETDQRVVVAEYGDGYSQRAAIGINSIYQKWTVQVNYLTLTDRNTMVSFYNAHGRVISFDWTPPNGSAGKYVFSDPLTETSTGNLYNFSMTLMQVFE